MTCLNGYPSFAGNPNLLLCSAGVSQGRKPDLVGGGLIRSLGGWKEVKKPRLNRQDGVKGDERILGDVFRQQEENEHACMFIWSHKF